MKPFSFVMALMLSVFTVAALAMPAVAAEAKPDGTLPNIVLIYADDLGYGDVSCNGGAEITPPHNDRPARQGPRVSPPRPPQGRFWRPPPARGSTKPQKRRTG